MLSLNQRIPLVFSIIRDKESSASSFIGWRRGTKVDEGDFVLLDFRVGEDLVPEDLVPQDFSEEQGNLCFDVVTFFF